jgi:WD40 repeat protein
MSDVRVRSLRIVFDWAILINNVPFQVWKIKEGPKGDFLGVDDKNFTTMTGKNGHKAGVNSVAFSSSTMIAFTSSKDNTLKKWNLGGDYKLGFEPQVLFTGHD